MSSKSRGTRTPKQPTTPTTPAPTPTATFTPPVRGAKAARVHKSTVEHPVATVWVICANLQGAGKCPARATLTAACLGAGVADYTARTQVNNYIVWDKAGRTGKLPRGVSIG